jgi:acyl carrier protein
VTDGTPSHLKLLAAAEDLSGLPLRHMLIGGEALPRATVGKLFERLAVHGQAPTITNVYGPTETCVDASVYDIVPGQFEADNESVYMPLGKPLGNNRVYIMDAYGRLMPDGAEGELCIAGDGVGRGYLNLPDFTSDGFVADPFVAEEKMYKTGDLGHWLPDGNLAFGGRIGDQVKIRGYRIELGEIEAVMQQLPGIGKAVVLARPEAGAEAQPGMELCAYVVWKQAEKPHSISELKQYLSHQLPDYMLPPYFVELEEIPLTSSGKVDRKALLRHEVRAVGVREYVAPTNAVEAQFAQIWQEVLGVERVGIQDSFFELGGHSLKAMTLLSRTTKACGVEVPLQVLFETPTVYAIAQYVSDLEPQAFLSIKRAELREWYPLSLGQRRIYIVSQLGDAGIAYNMPATALIEGNVEAERMEQAFGELVRRHESLRTSFLSVNGVPVQKVHDKASFQIAVLHAGDAGIESVADSFVQPFDLSMAPLMRLGLMELAEDKHLLLFDMHHLISDGVSIGILLGELAQLYAGNGLPELRLQYKDYAVWQNERASNGYGAEEKYWLTKLGGELPVLQLLTDYPRPSVQSFQGDRVSVVLGPLLKEKLNRLAEQNNTTLYTVLLSARQIYGARRHRDRDANGRKKSCGFGRDRRHVRTNAGHSVQYRIASGVYRLSS